MRALESAVNTFTFLVYYISHLEKAESPYFESIKCSHFVPDHKRVVLYC